MRRQRLCLINSKNINNHNIAVLAFNENTIIIIYDEFTPNLYKFIFLNNIFLIPRNLFVQYKNKPYIIADNCIRSGSDVLRNDCTLNDVSYLPQYIVNNEELVAYNKWFWNSIHDCNITSFNEALLMLQHTNISHSSYDNVYARLTRMRDFGQPRLASRLTRLFTKSMSEFDRVSSLSIQTHDFTTKHLDIKIKLNDSVYIYKPDGYHTFIDTLTKHFFYYDGDTVQFLRLMVQYPIPVVFYGILNYNLSYNIHQKTNTHITMYKILLSKLETYEN